MSIEINKVMIVGQTTKDGINSEDITKNVQISWDFINETPVVSGLVPEGDITLEEVKSLYDDMKYVYDKSS